MNMDAGLKKIQKLNATALKIIAAVIMVIDHTGYMFFPKLIWIRKIGRLAFPIFAFFIAEGFFYTKDRRRYLLRMLLFAFISELPFDLAFFGKWYWKYQNVMFSFALAILALMIFEKCRANGTWWGRALGLAGIALCAVASVLLNTDYSYYAVVLVAVFYIFRSAGRLCSNCAGLLFQVIDHPHDVQTWSILSFIPLMLYNGQKGPGLKWFFYLFYPGHLLVMYAIRMILLGYWKL